MAFAFGILPVVEATAPIPGGPLPGGPIHWRMDDRLRRLTPESYWLDWQRATRDKRSSYGVLNAHVLCCIAHFNFGTGWLAIGVGFRYAVGIDAFNAHHLIACDLVVGWLQSNIDMLAGEKAELPSTPAAVERP